MSFSANRYSLHSKIKYNHAFMKITVTTRIIYSSPGEQDDVRIGLHFPVKILILSKAISESNPLLTALHPI